MLNQDETYTTKTAPTAWDPSTMVNKVADPTNYRYWDQTTDSAVRRNDTVAQLTAKDFTVTITKDGQVVKPDANGKYDLSKPGIYTVTYSRDFNGTTISNSGQITVTSVKEPDNPSDNHNTNPGDNGNHNTNPGNNNDINNGTQNGNNNGINNGTQNGNGNKTVNTNVTDNGNGDNSQNNKQALPQTGNTKNDAAVAGLGLAGLLAMLGLGGLKKKRN